jgi:site-specific DNA recombinase
MPRAKTDRRTTHEPAVAAPPKRIRCAIYTRKSTEEGLEQEFNSLDAQREAGEAFIGSQKHEGWQLVPQHFDDGGFTGGNMDRPALQELLSLARAKKIDCVLVYKVDRLSRSLLDFTKMMELFDKNGVSFVSVTQQFNTTNSLGRLTLNILLSFAQFERELISERTRDKATAARKKGKWIGGHPVLGYDIAPKGGHLVTNAEEAKRVRAIFDLYLRHGALMPVVAELDQLGWRSKQWTTEAGHERGGRVFLKNSLYAVLTNPIYAGMVCHKGALYPGEHEALVERSTWDLVQTNLHHNGQSRGKEQKNKYGALLRGLLFCTPCGSPMVHTFTPRGPKLYRYYVCYTAQQKGWKTCETKSVSAPAIETAVLNNIRKMGANETLRSAVVEGIEAESNEQRAELDQQSKAAQKQLLRLNADLARHAADTRSNTCARFDRIAELHREIESAEHKLADLAMRTKAFELAAADPNNLRQTLERFDPIWEKLTTRDQERLIRTLITKVGYDGRTGKVTISFRHQQGKALCQAE